VALLRLRLEAFAEGADMTLGAVETEKHCKTCKCFAPKKKRSGLKRDSADARWSKMVRERAGFRCQFVGYGVLNSTASVPGRCSMALDNGLAPQGLHAAHCFTRGNPRTRTDPDNGLAMCWPHHRAIDGDKSLKFFVFRYWLGEERFDALQAKANAKRNRDAKP
jgi:hypothetical protein